MLAGALWSWCGVEKDMLREMLVFSHPSVCLSCLRDAECIGAHRATDPVSLRMAALLADGRRCRTEMGAKTGTWGPWGGRKELRGDTTAGLTHTAANLTRHSSNLRLLHTDDIRIYPLYRLQSGTRYVLESHTAGIARESSILATH